MRITKTLGLTLLWGTLATAVLWGAVDRHYLRQATADIEGINDHQNRMLYQYRGHILELRGRE